MTKNCSKLYSNANSSLLGYEGRGGGGGGAGGKAMLTATTWYRIAKVHGEAMM